MNSTTTDENADFTSDIFMWAKARYGKDVKSVFLVVTTLKGTTLKQDSFAVLPPDGKATPN